MRTIHRRYEDPLDRIWLECAKRIGLRVVREPGAYASTDGRGTLRLAMPEELDADDCLAQMVFHELCHSLVEGPESFSQEDWGLDNTSTRDVVREHAALRLQAFLTRSRGLGVVLAPTTEFREFYDALPEDPFEGDPFDSSITLAKQALARVGRPPWSPHLEAALDATATIAALAKAAACGPPSLDLPPLWSAVEAASPRHPAGFPLARRGTPAASERCGTCGFLRPERHGVRCVKAGAPTKRSQPACERWEPALDCSRCGACCREGFDVIEVSPRERFARVHRSLLVAREDGRFDLPRPEGRCPPLRGDGANEPFRCATYAERPRTCRDFEVGGDACLRARRRVGLST